MGFNPFDPFEDTESALCPLLICVSLSCFNPFDPFDTERRPRIVAGQRAPEVSTPSIRLRILKGQVSFHKPIPSVRVSTPSIRLRILKESKNG